MKNKLILALLLVLITPLDALAGLKGLSNTGGGGGGGTVTSVSGAAPIVSSGGNTPEVSCATCATTTNGGAISGTAPISVSASGVISAATGTSGATLPFLNGANTWSGVQTNTAAIIPTPVVPAISTATFTMNAALGNTFRIVLVHAACPCTLANPTNAVDGEKIIVEVVQSATGSDTIGSYGANFDFGNAGQPTLSTGVNKEDFLGFQFSSQNSKWNYVGSSLGL